MRKFSNKQYKNVDEPVLALDIEKTGCYMISNEIIAVGMAVYIPGDGLYLRRFTFKIAGNYEDKCVEQFWNKNQELLAELTRDQEFNTWKEFMDVIDDLDKKYNNLMIVSDNSSYDIAHINHALEKNLGRRGLNYKLDEFYRNIIDTDSFLAAFYLSAGLWVNTNKVLSSMDLQVLAKHDHYPENDAMFILESFLAVVDKKRA